MGCGSWKSAHKTCPSTYEPLDSVDFIEATNLHYLLLSQELLQPPPSPSSTHATPFQSNLQTISEEADLE
jgi:hypothetical protein